MILQGTLMPVRVKRTAVREEVPKRMPAGLARWQRRKARGSTPRNRGFESRRAS